MLKTQHQEQQRQQPPQQTSAAVPTTIVNPSTSTPMPDTTTNATPTSASSSSATSSAPRRHRKPPHELLTEAEKKANHIASEQKRRQNIRLGFDQLIEIVPSLNHGNRSEALILQKSVEHIRNLIAVKNDLKNQVRDLQTILGDPTYEEDSSEDELSYSYR
ncbi:hypothetical protein BCR43DRAFT_498621 [Syncephalastrum racemosum]|uniref:BHLH domain-containing protein n=1 Tax=Syncephalastrum racemosum TaxID=13706 RepID=A0A1X2H1E7_SYNRA|nr:hypothetical protein BCR43DRAFT_498621 [Syncephalastrum racemosum]